MLIKDLLSFLPNKKRFFEDRMKSHEDELNKCDNKKMLSTFSSVFHDAVWQFEKSYRKGKNHIFKEDIIIEWKDLATELATIHYCKNAKRDVDGKKKQAEENEETPEVTTKRDSPAKRAKRTPKDIVVENLIT